MKSTGRQTGASDDAVRLGTKPLQRRSLFLAAAAGLGFLASVSVARAQDSLSDPLSAPSDQTDGLNTSFEAESSNLTNPSLHSDVSDPTHSQLDGSELAPADNPQVLSYVYAVPSSGILTDAQSAVNRQDPYFGGKRSQSFTAGSTASGGAVGSVAARAASMATLGTGTLESAFSTGSSGRAAFSGQSVSMGNSGGSFSGEGVAVPAAEQGVGVKQAPSVNGQPEAEGAYLATDPVLSGSASGYEANQQLIGELPPPTLQIQQTFADSEPPVAEYQYDDGQTPSLTPVPHPGILLTSGITPEYLVSPTGFPDSTKGLAGLPTERSDSLSPLSSPLSTTSIPVESPFAPVSSGSVFEMKDLLNPTLHPQATARNNGSNVPMLARRAEQERITRGVSITDSAAMYRQDMQNYARQRAGERHRPTLEELDSPNRMAAAGVTRAPRTLLPGSIR